MSHVYEIIKKIIVVTIITYFYDKKHMHTERYNIKYGPDLDGQLLTNNFTYQRLLV